MPGAWATGIGSTAFGVGSVEQAPPSGSAQSWSTPRASSLATAVGLAPLAVLELTVTVVKLPVRATPATMSVSLPLQSRSVKSVASSPTPGRAYVWSSWARSSRQPANQLTSAL